MKTAALATVPLILSCAHTPRPVEVDGAIQTDSNYMEFQEYREGLAKAEEAKRAKEDAAELAFRTQYVGSLAKPVKDLICETVGDFDIPTQKYGYISAGDGDSANIESVYVGQDYSGAMAAGDIADMTNNTLLTMAQTFQERVEVNSGTTGLIPIPELRLKFPHEAFVNPRYEELYNFQAHHKGTYMVFDGGTGPYEYCESMVIHSIPSLKTEWQPDEMFILTCGKSRGTWDSFASVMYKNPPKGLSLGGDTSKEWTSSLDPDQRSVRMATVYMMNEGDIIRVGFSRTTLKGTQSATGMDAMRVDMGGNWPCKTGPWANNLGFPIPPVDELFENLDDVYDEALKPRTRASSYHNFFGIPGISYDLSVPLKN